MRFREFPSDNAWRAYQIGLLRSDSEVSSHMVCASVYSIYLFSHHHHLNHKICPTQNDSFPYIQKVLRAVFPS